MERLARYMRLETGTLYSSLLPHDGVRGGEAHRMLMTSIPPFAFSPALFIGLLASWSKVARHA